MNQTNYFIPNNLPNLVCLPLDVVGIPVERAIFCLIVVIPNILLNEKVKFNPLIIFTIIYFIVS